MKARVSLWIALLVLPAWASASEPVKPGFDLRNASVQGILRAAAADHATETPEKETGSRIEAQLADLHFRAPRRVHHTKCDGEDCIAYTADNEPLFSMDRELRRDLASMSTEQLDDAWLSCQDTNNLLSTFERFDRCRGIRVGPPPLQLNGVGIKLPRIRL